MHTLKRYIKFSTALLLFISAIQVNAQKLGTGLSRHTIVLNSSGTVYTWGRNQYGQLGNGNTGTESDIPVTVDDTGVLSGKTITQIATGSYHSIAIASDGSAYTWGNNDFGQLGNGNSGTNSNVPVAIDASGVLSGKTITESAGGVLHSLAIASDGNVYTWGRNNFGQLGNGNTGTDSGVPVAVYASGVLSGKTIIAIAGGSDHSIALASDGTVYAWGSNVLGQLGNGNTGTDSNVPVAVSTSGVLSGKTITAIAAGYYHNLALASDGTLYTWGRNQNGQLGNGNMGTDSDVPVAVNTSGVLSGKIITAIAAGNYYSLALADDGCVYTWGTNSYGVLGNGNTGTDSDVPVAVSTSGVLSGKTITAIAAGYYHSIALDTDGYIYTWGQNQYSQLGDGNSGTNSNVPVEVDQSGIGALPVELTSFAAELNENKVELNWQTATEVNNFGFEVQKLEISTQNSQWEKVGLVQGNGTTNSPKEYSFTDDLTLNHNLNRINYRLKQIDNDGTFTYSKIVTVDLSNITSVDDDINYEYSLEQNYPNPFNPTTSIKYQVASVENVKLVVFNSLGQQVATLVNEQKTPGSYQVNFNAGSLSSGIYFYKISIGNRFNSMKKMLLIK